MLECCQNAFAGQISGKCISMLPEDIRPTTSPTNTDRTADFWYPMYEITWSTSGCSNKLPLPYNNVNDRPNYSSGEECCAKAYGGQTSMACVCEHLDTPQLGCPGIIEYELTTMVTVATGTISLGDITIPADETDKAELVANLELTIFNMLLDTFGSDLQEVKILSIDGDPVRRSLRSIDDRLLTTSADVQYEVVVQSQCSENCESTTAVADQVVNQVTVATSDTTSMENAIQSSGNLALNSVTVQGSSVDQNADITSSTETVVGVSCFVSYLL